MREMLRRFSTEHGLPEVGTVVAEDCMDDGTPIRLAVTIDRRNGSAVFDFAGGGPCPTHTLCGQDSCKCDPAQESLRASPRKILHM